MATNYAVAPGEYLQEWLDSVHASEPAAANKLALLNLEQLDEILIGSVEVTFKIARSLEWLTAIPVASWLALQEQYDADRIRLGL